MPSDVSRLSLWIVMHGVVLISLGSKVYCEIRPGDAPFLGGGWACAECDDHLDLH